MVTRLVKYMALYFCKVMKTRYAKSFESVQEILMKQE